MSGADRPGVLVVGIGNPDRGDDGFGPAVARRLRSRAPAGAGIIECAGDVLALLDRWKGFDTVFAVDAAAPGGEPGRFHRFDLAGAPLPVRVAGTSTHALGLSETVELARSLGRLPRRFIAYIVEGERFDVGTAMSPSVAAAVAPSADRILAELILMGFV